MAVEMLADDRIDGELLYRLQHGWRIGLDTDALWSPPELQVRRDVKFVRKGLSGEVLRVLRVENVVDGLRPDNSSSFGRAPAPRKDFVRGRGSYFPFAPGGLTAEGGGEAVDGVEDTSVKSGKDGYLLSAPGIDAAEPFANGDVSFDVSPDPHAWRLPRISRGTSTQIDAQEDAALVESADVADTAEIDDYLPSEFGLAKTKTRGLAPAKPKDKTWAHMVDVNRPMGNFRELVPDLAFEHPFELDTFQKEAVYHLEQSESVFVAAHTSAGKTVVAEYAIALAAKHMTRAIYTSPIKALSNQKYRDFRMTFDSVGILTGDVQLHPEASCLIMTTEILRSMLYRGADLIRDVEYVIFDEVHYVNDQERGVVWEEVIIMLPEHVTLILLSATVPNTFEFANWVGRTKQKDIYVISTLKRPVPLEHHLYANKKFHKIVDADKQWVANGYRDAKESLQRNKDLPKAAPNQGTGRGRGANRGSGQQMQRGGRGGRSGGGTAQPFVRGGTMKTMERHDKNVWVHLVNQLNAQKLLPTVIFVFSKKRCEENASILSNVDLCNGTEKSQIHIAIEKATSSLKEEDRQLPQIIRMRELLGRGLAVHHGGLLPIVKEMVEILFARGLVKVLFATETFAMGVNMPAKSVVFSGIRKHDGHGFRDLTPGEYTQMAGRAGRRGLDATGTVIITCGDEAPDQSTLHTMLLGQPFKLQSQFRLTYNMILNLLRVETLQIEEMIKRSFSENASQTLLPEQQKLVLATQAKLDAARGRHADVSDADRKKHAASVAWLSLTRRIIDRGIESLGRKALGSGRLVVLQSEEVTRHLGVVLGESATSSASQRSFSVFALRPDNVTRRVADLMPFDPAAASLRAASSPQIDIVPAEQIDFVTKTSFALDAAAVRRRVRVDWDNLRAQMQACTPGDFEELDWLKLAKDIELRDALTKRSAIALSPVDNDAYAACHEEHLLARQLAHLSASISAQNLELLPDYEQRCAVLRELGFLSSRGSVTLKGRVACEIEGEHELVLTELMLDNALAAYDHAETCALLSAFVFQERTDERPALSARLAAGVAVICDAARRVDAVQERHQVLVSGSGASSDDWQPDAARFGLVAVCEAWARGVSFKEICDLTDVLEGTIVRCIVRLDEVLRACQSAARVVGDTATYTKLEECRELIKRDVVFSASLFW